MSEPGKINKRDFLKNGRNDHRTAVAATTIGAPYVARAQSPIRWRLQTYAGVGSGRARHQAFDRCVQRAANGEMVIELYTADQLVPQGELFRAVQTGTIDAAQSDDDSMAAPVDVAVFAAYFPFASRYSLDVPVLWNWYGLKEIWEEAYAEIEGVTWLSTGAWDPCNFATTKPIALARRPERARVYTFPTGGRFMQRFGVVPITLPYEDVEVAVQTGELDGVCWSGITEDYTVGWADVTKYYLTNPISGAWAGSYFVNTEKWKALPEHLKTLFRLSMDSSHYYRQHWYWWGEARYRTRRQARADHDPGRGVGDRRGGGARVLGRDRGREPAERQGRPDPQGLRRHDAQSRPALPLREPAPARRL